MECSIYDALVLIVITNVHMYVCIRTADMMAASFLSARPCKRSSQISSGCGTTGSFLNGNDVYYSFTPDFNGVVNITMTPTGNDTGITQEEGPVNDGLPRRSEVYL